jgi:aminocarboxymuconate-semialdehyde decarboxylase
MGVGNAERAAIGAIDLHAHVVPSEIVEFLAREGARFDTQIVESEGRRFFEIAGRARRPIVAPIHDPEARLPDMDAHGVSLQAVSAVPFLMYPELEPTTAAEFAARVNDGIRGIAAHASHRFLGVATVALQDGRLAAGELDRARGLGFVAVEIPARLPGRELDDRALDPFWEAAAALGMPVCIHPFDACPAEPFSRFALGNVLGNGFDTAIAASLLAFGGVLERHPRLRVVLRHGGGAFPALLGRLDWGHGTFAECRTASARKPSDFLDHFWFDDVTFDASTFRALVDRVGAARVVVGSDHPLIPYQRSRVVEQVSEVGLDDATVRAILRDNAAALLGITST